MRATSPRDDITPASKAVSFVEIPQPRYPIGTKVDVSSIRPDNLEYYWRLAVRSSLRDTRKIVDSLQRQGYMRDMKKRKMLEHNKKQIRDQLDMMRFADSVEIAGVAPRAMHAVGRVANQCYLTDGQCHSGVYFDCYLLFRREVDGQHLVYIHAHPMVRDTSITALTVSQPTA